MSARLVAREFDSARDVALQRNPPSRHRGGEVVSESLNGGECPLPLCRILFTIEPNLICDSGGIRVAAFIAFSIESLT